METRQEILDRLLSIQVDQRSELISREEIEEIRRLWSEELVAPTRSDAASVNTLVKKVK